MSEPRNWVVKVHTDNDPVTFGPYSQQQAERLRDQFNARIDVDDFELLHATAHRLRGPRVTEMLAEFGQ